MVSRGLKILWSFAEWWVVLLLEPLVWVNFTFRYSLSRNESTRRSNSSEDRVSKLGRASHHRNRKERQRAYNVATYTGILSFLWDVPCRSVRILSWESFLGIHFLISQTLIGKFVMESAPLTVQDLILLLPIDKVGWKLFTLSVFCLRIGQNSKGVEEKGDD